MRKNKIMLISVVALMGTAPILSTTTSAHTVQADSSITKTIMHNALAYDKDGNSTGHKYYVYGSVHVDPKLVTIKEVNITKLQIKMNISK